MRNCRLVLLGMLALLAVAGRAHAVAFTVGDDEPGAEYTTIQEALDAALATTGYREVRVAAGRYSEHVQVRSDDLRGIVELSGGWNESFTSRSLDPAVTVVDAAGPGPGRPMLLVCGGGSVRVEGITLTGGHSAEGASGPADGLGGGLFAELRGTCRVTLDRLHVEDNVAGDAPPYSLGGGMALRVQDASRLTLRGSRIERNRAVNGGSVAAGGGLDVAVVGGAEARLLDNRIVDNLASGAKGANAAGLSLGVSGGGSATVLDNVIARNSVAPGTASSLVVLGVALDAGVDAPLGTCIECGGEIEWRRNRVEGNRAEDVAGGEHVFVNASRRSRVTLSDSLIAGGPGAGLVVLATGEAHVTAGNLTLAGHGGSGLIGGGFDAATVELANSIVWGNGDDTIPGGIAGDHNLAGVDPRFVDAAAGDHRLQVGSPAIDAGTLSPAGGLPPWDLDRQDRVVGASVDQGAHELQSAGPDGSRCAILDPLDVPRTTPACICLSDASLRELRCAFFHSDLLVTLRLPFDTAPGKPFDASWSLDSWRGVEGPYEIQAALIAGGKEEDLPKPEGDGWLADGKLAGSKVTVIAPKGEAQLRTVLRYLPAGAKQPRQVVLDAMLPAGRP